jgi:septal ring factor EnvC (AmiA/AmiB activator)
MEAFFSQLPYAGLIITIVVIVLGGAAAFYMLSDYNDKRKKKLDASDDRLINLLQTTVAELEKKVNKQTTDIESLTKKVTALERENETLVKVLQGRDAQTQKFYEQGFESMKTTGEIYETLTRLVEGISVLGHSIEKNNDMTTDFVKTIKEHFLNVEKVAISK